MKRPLPFEKISAWFLLAFATTAAFSIFWQHLVWVSVLFWLIAWAKGRVKPEWPGGILAVATLLFFSTFLLGALSGVNPTNSFGTLHRDLTFLVFFLVGAMKIDFPRVQKILLFFTHGSAFCALWGISKHFTAHGRWQNSRESAALLIGGLFLAAILAQLFYLQRKTGKNQSRASAWLSNLSLLMKQPRGAYLALGACFCLFLAIAEHLSLWEDRIQSFGGYIMIFGGSLMTALVVQTYFLFREPKSARHWTVASLLAFALLLNQTRGAWIGLAVGLLLMLFFLKRKWILPLLALAVAGFFLLPSQYQNRVRSIWDPAIHDPWAPHSTTIERSLMWKAGLAISKDYPFFGIGQGNLMDVYPKYILPEAREKEIIHLHNNFVQILVQNGWVGFLAYLFWLSVYFFESLRKRIWPEAVRNWNLVLTCLFLAGLTWGMTEYTFSHQFMNLQFFFMGLQANLWKTAKQKK